MFSKIEPSRLLTVERALKVAFGENGISEVELIRGGYSSSQMYKIFSNGTSYVLRIMGLDQPIEDRKQQVKCLEIASSLALAPKVHHADAESGILIMEYIQHQEPRHSDWLIELAKSLRVLHGSSQPFPKYLGPSHFLFELLNNLRQEELPKYLVDYFIQIEKIVNRLETSKELKSCHNDLNGGNILWNGQKVVLIDFEAATLEDPYFDLATIINHFIFESNLETRFLSAYFDGEIRADQWKKLALMKQFSFCYYAAYFLTFARQQNVEYLSQIELDNLPSLEEFRIGFKEGTLQLDTPHQWMSYGMSFIKASLTQMNDLTVYDCCF